MYKRVVATLFVLAGCQTSPTTASDDPAALDNVASLEQAAVGSSNVTVVNTAANPVPVTGAIQSQQSGSWTVAQSGSWTVGQNGTWNVNVNSVNNPIAVGSLPAVHIDTMPNVTVANLPATQPVSGVVDVGYLPPVSGTVAVSNFPAPPASQTVNGTVAVSNFPAPPASQTVNGTVAVSNFPAFPSTQAVSGSVSVSNFPAAPTTTLLYTFDGFPAGGELITPVLNIAAYKEIRVLMSSEAAFDARINSGAVMMDNRVWDGISSTGKWFSQAYTTPGTQLQLQILATSLTSIRIYGRTN